jgi:hypothetical protein
MAWSKSDHIRQQEESDAPVATVNAFLTVGLFALLGQAHDELKSEDRGYHLGSRAGRLLRGVGCRQARKKSPRLAESAHRGYNCERSAQWGFVISLTRQFSWPRTTILLRPPVNGGQEPGRLSVLRCLLKRVGRL